MIRIRREKVRKIAYERDDPSNYEQEKMISIMRDMRQHTSLVNISLDFSL